MAMAIAAAIVTEVSEKTRDSKHVPTEIVQIVVEDLNARMKAKQKGFENKSQIGKTVGVAQPSVSAWFGKDPGMSWATLDAIEARTGKDYAGRRKLPADEQEWAMRWRALVELARDARYDMGLAFTAVSTEALDRSIEAPTWNSLYKSVKGALDERVPKLAQPPDIPRGKGLPKKRG
jgi:hypothetical protein